MLCFFIFKLFAQILLQYLHMFTTKKITTQRTIHHEKQAASKREHISHPIVIDRPTIYNTFHHPQRKGPRVPVVFFFNINIAAHREH